MLPLVVADNCFGVSDSCLFTFNDGAGLLLSRSVLTVYHLEKLGQAVCNCNRCKLDSSSGMSDVV